MGSEMLSLVFNDDELDAELFAVMAILANIADVDHCVDIRSEYIQKKLSQLMPDGFQSCLLKLQGGRRLGRASEHALRLYPPEDFQDWLPEFPKLLRKGADGFVYLLKSTTGLYKIGRTRNPKDRLKTFAVKLPFEVEFECLIKTADMFDLESDLHGRFIEKNVRGEWFDLAPADVEYIKGLAGVDNGNHP